MMIKMHTSLYPETPDYDLGKRFEKLIEEYLNPLMACAPEAPGRTPTEGVDKYQPPSGFLVPSNERVPDRFRELIRVIAFEV